MLFGTAVADAEGQIHMSETGKQRCYRAAVAYFDHRFDRRPESLLVSGGFSKDLKDAPPASREALLIADFLIKRCDIPAAAIVTETHSMSSIENIICSAEEFPDFFEGIKAGEEKIGLVSHPHHLARVAFIGSELLPCPVDRFIRLPTTQQDNKTNEEMAFAITRQQVADYKAAHQLAKFMLRPQEVVRTAA